MFNKYLTIVVIPRKTSKVRKINVPTRLFGFVFVLLILTFSGLLYVIVDYLSIRSHLAGLEESKRQYNIHEKQIKEFSNRYEDVLLHFEFLKTLNFKLKSMVITSMSADKKSKRTRESEQDLLEKESIASKNGILEVITSDASEVDSDLIYERARRFQNMAAFFKNRHNIESGVPGGWPTKGFLIDQFGIRTDPFTGQMRPQNGINIASRLDFPIYAPADGIVLTTEKEENYGNILMIDHGNGFATRYGHISRFEVEEGEIIKKGKIIALVGNSGRTTGPLLYYEVIFNGIPQNPVKYIYN